MKGVDYLNSIKVRRSLLGLTQDEIASKLSISRTTISMWETGETMPRADKLPELAKILNCTIDSLFKTETDEQTAVKEVT